MIGRTNAVVASGGVTPTGEKTITTTASVDVSGYATARVQNPSNFVEGNIRSGVTLLGVSGKSQVVDTTISSDGATAASMLSGKKAYVNGSLITGTIASKTAATYTPSTSNQTITSGQYLNGTQTILGDSDLVAGNIKKGVTIFNVTGTLDSGGINPADFGCTQIAKKTFSYISNTAVNNTHISHSLGTYPIVVIIAAQDEIYTDTSRSYLQTAIGSHDYYTTWGAGGSAVGQDYGDDASFSLIGSLNVSASDVYFTDAEAWLASRPSVYYKSGVTYTLIAMA